MSLRLMSAAVLSSSFQQASHNEAKNSENLLKRLLECVQQCQKRFGGKKELATEFDSCVIGLCFTLEAVLLHGLRIKPINNENHQSSALKQVSDIVTNSLHIGNENPSFWPFVSKHLTNHEHERYSVLKHIWTDTGRGRAWIRSSLNERSLERYLHILLSNPKILTSHYEDWALLRDQEKSCMLPNMAAGVASILFAISIDKPELNSGLPQKRLESLQSKVEPIIEAPILGRNKDSSVIKQKRKRKVARQIISFDEDESNCSMLSTSVPSSSGSIISSTSSDSSNSAGDNQSSKGVLSNKPHLNQIEEENKNGQRSTDQVKDSTNNNNNNNNNNEVSVLSRKEQTEPKQTDHEDKTKTPAKRKLSVETSGSREKFLNETLPETLTPVSYNKHVEFIGELTPISVEINDSLANTSTDDILEVPTDISAVLTALESRNKEELQKKQDRIDNLKKENETLKEQIQKYVSAIQMLKRDDEDDGVLHNALSGLEIEPQPDYRGEAKLFEKKLVQVAEMHAELMDFNVTLQQQLCRKESLLEKLKSELEELRGPMPTDDLLTDSNTGNVSIWIPSAFLTGTGSSSHHVYQIYLRAGSDEWNIYRRYAQFHALHVDLKKLDPTVATFDFPPKKSIGKKDSALVEDRRKRLQVYLRRVLAHWPELMHCNSKFLLEQHLAFFKDQKETVDSAASNSRSIFSPRRGSRSNTSDNHYTGL